jgi:peptidoglycan/LPS O-acetylase OafA/YrhL
MAARPAPGLTTARDRVVWLDGVRGAAATFVVLHHMWLVTWPGFPRDTGPWWLGWLLYGHLAVAVFIVVSGFSLALAPMRSGGELRGGVRRFLRRRAWRILPPYWAALVLSMVITVGAVRPDLGAGAIARSLAVHGVLLQDVIASQTPNGAFWSIAVEWQIYFAFPVLLWLGRRWGIEVAVALAVAAALLAHAAARLGGPLEKLDGLTPQFFALFALGVLAVKLGHGVNGRRLRRPLVAIALVAALAVVVAALVRGSAWVVDRYFYVDLLAGLAVACWLCLLVMGRLTVGRRVLASRAARRLGLFSYSTYLIHGPIVVVLSRHVTGRLDVPAPARFAALLVLGLPLVLVLSYGFHLVFEAPFLRRRERRALRSEPVGRLIPHRPPVSAG